MKFIRFSVISALCLVSALCLNSCKADPEYVGQEYGYVQFKLYKEASYSKAVVPELDYLGDAGKILVVLQYGDVSLSQTLTLSASGAQAAEFGLRSDKLKLLAGEYKVLSFTLYDKLDNELYKGNSAGEFSVTGGGLVSHDITVGVVARGWARFSLVKSFEAKSKAATREFTFDEISYVDLTVKNAVTGVRTAFKGLPAEFVSGFDDSGTKPEGYSTTWVECDTLVSIKAGDYVFDSYTLYDEDKKMLEIAQAADASGFSIADNATTEASVAVTLRYSDKYLQDYFALKEVWESLDGPNWYYHGEDWPKGANWDFNKDPDLWGDQPGVQLHPNGRVALINISDFGFRGDLSPAIGELSELVELYLGTHNDYNQLEYDPGITYFANDEQRMKASKEYLSLLHPLPQLSEPVARALAEHNEKIPETALYDLYKEDELIEKGTGADKLRPMDTVHGKLCNGLRSLPDEIGKLTKLESLYIANGELETLPESMKGLVSLTDFELYNCSRMTECPDVIGELPALVLLNLGNNSQWDADQCFKAIKMLSEGPSAPTLQILYFNINKLSVLDGEAIGKMPKLSLMDFSNNDIQVVTAPFGASSAPVQLYLDHNHISSLPVDENGLFCKTDDIETFSATYNEFTEFPDIFDSKSIYIMGSVNFSFNHISRFQNQGEGYKGINCSTLTLNNNPELTVYPACLVESGSIISNLSFRACSLETIPEGSFTGETSKYIKSLDLSYNHLSDLPSEFNAVNVPYLYGIDLSYNRFSSFPWEPLDCYGLTVFGIRGQRNAAGERCLSEWPTGLYNHKGLRGFYIGSNNLGKITDTISTLIYFLDISDNPEIIFDASDICAAYANGLYYLIYDKTQDIRSCEYIALD